MNEVNANLDDNLLSVEECVNYLSISTPTFLKEIDKKEIPVIRIGKRILIHKDDFNEYINKKRKASVVADKAV